MFFNRISTTSILHNPEKNVELPQPVIYYTCKINDVDIQNKKIKNQITGNYDISYNNVNFISSDDTNFSTTENWGSFNSDNNNFSYGVNNVTPVYNFTGSSRAISICYWVKVTSLQNPGFYVFDIGKGNNSTFTNLILPEMGYNTQTGYLTYIYLYVGNVNFNYNNVPSNFDVRNWFHVCMIVENQKSPLLYINGSKVNSTNTSILTLNGFTTLSHNSSFISGKPSGQTNRIPCKLNELRIYNHALSSIQVKKIYDWNGINLI